MELPPAPLNRDRVGVTPVEVKSPEDLDGMIVNVEILEFPEDGEHAVGRVIEILGRPDDFGVDVEIMIRKHHIPHHFPPEVLEQAQSFSDIIRADELAGRQDFARSISSPSTARRRAISTMPSGWIGLPNGNYALQVHIADVSHYVRPGSPIDRRGFPARHQRLFSGSRGPHAAAGAFHRDLLAEARRGSAGAFRGAGDRPARRHRRAAIHAAA